MGLVTGPHARIPPHPQPVGSGPRQPAQRAGSWGWGSARPRTPHTQARGAPPVQPRAAPTARKASSQERAVGLVTGPHARIPLRPQPVGSGPRQPAQRAGSQGWESARPHTPHTQARGASPGHQHAAPTARRSARCGVGDGSPRPQAPRTHSQWVVGPGSPRRGRAVGGGRAPDPGRPTPRQEAPPPGTNMPPPQHAGARAVGLVTGPHARTPLVPTASG